MGQFQTGPTTFMSEVPLLTLKAGWAPCSRIAWRKARTSGVFFSALYGGSDYVQAARALGVKDRRIIFRHILPNALAPVFVTASLGVASAILIEAGLSFLGFGVQPPAPSWGNILTEGRTYIFDAWWLTLFPGLAILITVLSFNLFGEGLRDALDPRLRGRR